MSKTEGAESKRRSLVFSDDEGDTPPRKNVVENVKDTLGKMNEKGRDTRKALDEEQVPVVRLWVDGADSRQCRKIRTCRALI